MARGIAERVGGRIAVLGAASPAGAYLKAALADRAVPGERVLLYGHEREVAVLSEYDGEARLVQAVGGLDPASCAVVFVCEPGHDAEGLGRAASSGTLVVDLSGSVPDAVLAGVTPGPSPGRIVAVPHAWSTLIARLLAPVHRERGLRRASVFVLRPASDFGEPGLDELKQQTVHLLRFETIPTDVFGRQLAFNALPEHLLPPGEDAASARIERECLAILGAPACELSVSVALVPLFYGHALAAHLDLARPGREEALTAWRKTPGIEIAGEPSAGGTLDAPEGGALLVARVREHGPSLRVWAVGCDAGAGAAAQAVAIAADAGLLVNRS